MIEFATIFVSMDTLTKIDTFKLRHQDDAQCELTSFSSLVGSVMYRWCSDENAKHADDDLGAD